MKRAGLEGKTPGELGNSSCEGVRGSSEKFGQDNGHHAVVVQRTHKTLDSDVHSSHSMGEDAPPTHRCAPSGKTRADGSG
jgi:hypothetical protein